MRTFNASGVVLAADMAEEMAVSSTYPSKNKTAINEDASEAHTLLSIIVMSCLNV